MIKIAILTTVIGGSLIAGSWYMLENTLSPEPAIHSNNYVAQINNYDDCVAAGFAVLESLPEQCATDDGRVFTNNNAQPPLTNGIAEGELYGDPFIKTDDVSAAIEAVQSIAATEFATQEGVFDVTANTAEWPDSCLGLPEEDEVCAMMLTPGYEITLTINDKTAVYRTNLDGTMVKRFLKQ